MKLVARRPVDERVAQLEAAIEREEELVRICDLSRRAAVNRILFTVGQIGRIEIESERRAAA